ncbi:MAG: hypothetical protein KDK59_04175 [Simkania sp.]|nr:hypothetical protein [Simkania sp.]
MEDFHLSVVACSRNDDHGGNLLYRMQHFVSCFIEQCKKHELKAELILVEWNPPEEKKTLEKALKFPVDKGPCSIRIITVPNEVASKLAHSEDLPMFQMIAKNVGIRRARGKFVLATNIDILFSDELMRTLRDELQRGNVYRVDRLDIPSELPISESVDELLDFCKSHYFRINGRYGTQILQNDEWTFLDTSASRHNKKYLSLKNNLWAFWLRKLLLLFDTGGQPFNLDFITHLIRRVKYRFAMNIHANACGDFTLLSYDDWCMLRGYPEFKGFSWHLDAFLLYQALISGIQKKELSRDKSIYHIEHGKGSGYSPENHDLVFARIKTKGIPYIDDQELLKFVAQMVKMKKRKKPYIYNEQGWGFANHEFQEVIV